MSIVHRVTCRAMTFFSSQCHRPPQRRNGRFDVFANIIPACLDATVFRSLLLIVGHISDKKIMDLFASRFVRICVISYAVEECLRSSYLNRKRAVTATREIQSSPRVSVTGIGLRRRYKPPALQPDLDAVPRNALPTEPNGLSRLYHFSIPLISLES